MLFCHFEANSEMILEIRLLLGLLAVLSGSSQTRGKMRRAPFGCARHIAKTKALVFGK